MSKAKTANAKISYGKVKLTRHSVKHCKGKASNANPSRVLRAKKGEHLNTGAAYDVQAEFERELELALQKKHSECIDYEPIFNSEGDIVDYKAVYVKPKKKRNESNPATVKAPEDIFKKEMFKPFCALDSKPVSCAAKGSSNSGTKDKRVSCSVRSVDVDNVSEVTGIVSIARPERTKDKRYYNRLFHPDPKRRANVPKPTYPSWCNE